MGRRKISIHQIIDPKLRNMTFIKRRHGLMKKAAELSLLCNVNVLLIFEDGNGNLIQFSRNKITTIPSFFKECKYSSVSEFTANDYPNFFNASHKRKRREGKNDEESQNQKMAKQEDEFPAFEDLGLLAPEAPSSQKDENHPTSPNSISDDLMRSPGIVSYPGSEEYSHDRRDEIQTISEIQIRGSYCNEPREYQRRINKPEKIDGNQETYLNKRESFQNHKGMPMRGPIIEDRPTDYIQPRMPSKRPTKYFTEDWPHFYRHHHFDPNMPYHPDYRPNYGPYNYYDPYPHRPLNYDYPMPGGRAFREMPEEVADNMSRFPPNGYAAETERDEFIPIPENYVKNRKRITHYVDHEYQEMNPHPYRAVYHAYSDNIPSNLEEYQQAPYFNPGKCNIKPYTNSFENDGFNAFSEPKKNSNSNKNVSRFINLRNDLL